MGFDSTTSLSPEFKRFAPMFAQLTGMIIDAPCGYGRHSLFLQNMGCKLLSTDLNSKAISFLVNKDKILLPRGQSHLDLRELDLLDDNWPFENASFGGCLNVHLFSALLTQRLADCLRDGGLFYLETIANRKGNYEQLPDAGQLKRILENQFEFLYFKEKAAGPSDCGKVTVRLLAKKK